MKLFIQAMFKYNVVVYSGLGLFFILAGQQSFANALGLSIAFFFNLILSPLLILAITRWMNEDIKFLSYLIIFATVSTIVSMMMTVFFPLWIEGVERYLPLIAVSGILQYRSELIQSETKVKEVLIENIGTALGFLLIILPFAIVSEILGTGGLRLPSLTDGETMIFSFSWIPTDFQLGIFTGPYGYLGSLLLVGLGLSLIKYIQIKRGKAR
jgi:Na+-translocating ferredoxin:NAD+ oxidoreductase RnfE subunit